MYAFSPVQPYPPPPPGTYVELSRRVPHGMQFAYRAERALGVFLGQLVFDIACETLNVDTGYAIEKELSGAEFCNDDRKRWWEKLGRGHLDLRRALSRRDPQARRQIDLLSERTDALTEVLSMPLWTLSAVGRAPVHTIVSWRGAVETMGVAIPNFPVCTPDNAKQFVQRLMEPLADRKTWAAINVALFCLRLAQARGDLIYFTLIYETIASTVWELNIMLTSPYSYERAWRNLMRFYTEWFSTLRLTLTNEADFWEAVKDLESAGMQVEILRTSRLDDLRYASTTLRVPEVPTDEDLKESTLILPSFSIEV